MRLKETLATSQVPKNIIAELLLPICLIACGFEAADGHVQGGLTGDFSLMCPVPPVLFF
jgi:hypothetical protein